MIGPYGCGGSKLIQESGENSVPGGALTVSVVKLTLSTWDAACLMSSTIWLSSVSVWSRVTAVPPVYSASSDWQPFVVIPSPQKIPVGL